MGLFVVLCSFVISLLFFVQFVETCLLVSSGHPFLIQGFWWTNWHSCPSVSHLKVHVLLFYSSTKSHVNNYAFGKKPKRLRGIQGKHFFLYLCICSSITLCNLFIHFSFVNLFSYPVCVFPNCLSFYPSINQSVQLFHKNSGWKAIRLRTEKKFQPFPKLNGCEGPQPPSVFIYPSSFPPDRKRRSADQVSNQHFIHLWPLTRLDQYFLCTLVPV